MKRSGCLRWASLVLALLVLPGCASTLKLSAVPAPDQQVKYSSGSALVVSHKEFSSVVIKVDPLASTVQRKVCLFVGVKNASNQPSVFSSENIHVLADGKPLKVYPYEEMVESIEKQRRVATALTAIGGAMEGMGAYSAASTSYQSGTINAPGYQATYYGSTYDPAAGMQAQAEVNARTSNQLSNINQAAVQKAGAISQVALKKQTVEPGEVYGGTVFFESVGYGSEKRRLVLEVNWNGETHTFLLDARN